jgi:hypothetical protein
MAKARSSNKCATVNPSALSSSSKNNKTRKQEASVDTMQHIQLDPTMYQVFTLVLQQEVLHWNVALTLGGVCQETRSLWQENSNAYMSAPLLKLLEGMIDRGYHDDTNEDREEDNGHGHGRGYGHYHDFNKIWDKVLSRQLDKNYQTFYTMKKCEEIFSLLTSVVGNLHSTSAAEFCMKDPTNCNKNRACEPFNWSLGET